MQSGVNKSSQTYEGKGTKVVIIITREKSRKSVSK